jgi:FixJ family two-component response regulator
MEYFVTRAISSGTSMTERPSGFIVAVVDDDRRVLDSLGSLLESADLAALLFDSAAALLESGRLAEIDCLISDIGMPAMDGLELARVVRAARPGLPIILITGQSDVPHRSPPAGPGRYRLLKKPLNGEELLTAVGEALRDPRQGV